jgi:hypothetical protein
MSDTIRVVIPLTIRKRNGRPRILPPENVEGMDCRTQDPHVLRAIGRAWAWRRKIDTGEFNTAQDLADAEGISDRFISRMMRLSYLSPDVLHRLVTQQVPLALSLNELIAVTELPWAQQMKQVFDGGKSQIG